MRFVWAVLAFIVGAVCIGIGFADRALVDRPNETTMTVTTTGDAAYTLVTSEVLRAMPGETTLDVRTDGQVFAAIGRTTDIQAWLATTPYNEVLPPEQPDPEAENNETSTEPVVRLVTPAQSDATATAPAELSPVGSDLWLTEQTDPDRVVITREMAPGVAVLLAKDGAEPAPEEITLKWPLVHHTPWTGPLLVAGGAFLLLGTFLYVQAFRHRKRRLGPRRKGSGGPNDPAELTSRKARRSVDAAPRRRAIRSFAALPLAAVLVTASGCSAELWPRSAPETPSSTETATTDEVKQPALLPQQAARILERVARTSLEADEANSGTVAAERLSGEALKERQAEYDLKAVLPSHEIAPLLPTTDVKVLLPQANDAWPRTTLVAVAGATETDPPVVLMMTQDDPWSNYKVSYRAPLLGGVQMPALPPDWSGASLIPPGLTLFAAPPETVGEAFADVIDYGDASPYYSLFDDNALTYAQSVRDNRAAAEQQLVDDDAATTSRFEWQTRVSPTPPIALSTWESGALVAVAIEEVEKYVPTVPEASIRTSGSPAVQAVTGKDELPGGVTTVYGVQLFFSVPSEVSGGKISLLAKEDYLQSIAEIPEPDELKTEAERAAKDAAGSGDEPSDDVSQEEG